MSCLWSCFKSWGWWEGAGRYLPIDVQDICWTEHGCGVNKYPSHRVGVLVGAPLDERITKSRSYVSILAQAIYVASAFVVASTFPALPHLDTLCPIKIKENTTKTTPYLELVPPSRTGEGSWDTNQGDKVRLSKASLQCIVQIFISMQTKAHVYH